MPLHQRGARAGEIEPGLGAIRLPPRPCLGRGDRRPGCVVKALIEELALGVDVDLPPERDGAQGCASLGRRRRARFGNLRRCPVEVGAKDRIVDCREPGAFSQGKLPRRGYQRQQKQDSYNSHVTSRWSSEVAHPSS